MAGFFASWRELRRQTKEIEKTWDPVAQARQGVATMQAMTHNLAEQNASAHLAATGTPATATVTAVRDTGSRINSDPMVELDLLVTVPGRPPYPVTLRTVVPVFGQGRLAPGQPVSVRVNAALPQQVVVMWGEVPAG